MSKLLEFDRKQKDKDALTACKRDEILAEMTEIITQTRQLLSLPIDNYIGLEKDYYIYSDVRTRIIEKLMSDGLS